MTMTNHKTMVQGIEALEPFPAGENPFWHDLYHMGADVANDLCVMFSQFEDNKYIILINKTTGERVQIWFDVESPWSKMGDFNPEHHTPEFIVQGYVWETGQ